VELDHRLELWAAWVVNGRTRCTYSLLYRMVRDGTVIQGSGVIVEGGDEIEMETDRAIAALIQSFPECVGRSLLASLAVHDVVYGRPRLDHLPTCEQAKRLGISRRTYCDYNRAARAWLAGWFSRRLG
jgi:hypothetical protein